MSKILILALLASLSLISGRAAIVYSQAVTANPPGALISDFSYSSGVGSQYADNFTLGSADAVRSIRWWGDYGTGITPLPASSESFYVRFFADTGSGLPQLAAFKEYQLTSANITRIDSGFKTGGPTGPTVFQYDVTLPDAGVSLSASTTYYVSVVDSHTGDPDWRWDRTSSVTGDQVYSRAGGALDNTQSWSASSPTVTGGRAMGFVLANTTVVPEPHEYALVAALGLLAFAGWRRFRPQSA